MQHLRHKLFISDICIPESLILPYINIRIVWCHAFIDHKNILYNWQWKLHIDIIFQSHLNLINIPVCYHWHGVIQELNIFGHYTCERFPVKKIVFLNFKNKITSNHKFSPLEIWTTLGPPLKILYQFLEIWTTLGFKFEAI